MLVGKEGCFPMKVTNTCEFMKGRVHTMCPEDKERMGQDDGRAESACNSRGKGVDIYIRVRDQRLLNYIPICFNL